MWLPGLQTNRGQAIPELVLFVNWLVRRPWQQPLPFCWTILCLQIFINVPATRSTSSYTSTTFLFLEQRPNKHSNDRFFLAQFNNFISSKLQGHMTTTLVCLPLWTFQACQLDQGAEPAELKRTEQEVWLNARPCESSSERSDLDHARSPQEAWIDTSLRAQRTS